MPRVLAAPIARHGECITLSHNMRQGNNEAHKLSKKDINVIFICLKKVLISLESAFPVL